MQTHQDGMGMPMANYGMSPQVQQLQFPSMAQTQEDNDRMYKSLDRLQLDLTILVRKSESLRQLTQDVSYQATLKRLCANFTAQFNVNKNKAYVPVPNETESFERKFKLLRRNTHIIFDEMKQVRSFMNDLHDAVRLQKQQSKNKYKTEKLSDDLEMTSVKQEKSIFKQGPPIHKNQQIDLIEDDLDVSVVQVQEKYIKRETYNFDSKEPIINVCCTCSVQQHLGHYISEEMKLCLAIESLKNYHIQMNPKTIEECIKRPKLLQPDEGCIPYEAIYLSEKNPNNRDQFIPIPINNLELETKLLYGDSPTWFGCYDDVASLSNNSNLSLNLFKGFVSALKTGDQHNNGGSFNYLLKQLHIVQQHPIIINAYHSDFDKCQILADLLEAILQINGHNISVGVNQIIFPTSTKNSNIVLARYTRELSTEELIVLKENMNDGGCRIGSQVNKLERQFILFTKQKIYFKQQLSVKYWQIPVEHLNQVKEQYYYNYLVWYIDMSIHSSIQDKLAKFYTLLITVFRDKLNLPHDEQIEQELQLILNNNVLPIVKKVNILDDSENILEPLKQQRLLKSANRMIYRLLGHQLNQEY